jgi:hypothetical protein
MGLRNLLLAMKKFFKSAGLPGNRKTAEEIAFKERKKYLSII